MNCQPLVEEVVYTPEQRRLLARAYRLILSWPRERISIDADNQQSYAEQSKAKAAEKGTADHD